MFTTFLVTPLLNILVLLYNSIAFNDVGLAIIELTIVIRVILYPLYKKQILHQQKTQALQPKLKALQAEHKGDRQKQGEALLALYKEHNFNPLSGLFLLIIQIPVLFAIYKVIMAGFSSEALSLLYSFIKKPIVGDSTLFGLINLSQSNIIILVLTVIAQYVQGKMMLAQNGTTNSNDPAARMSRQMVYIGPLLTLVFFSKLPAAITLYWLASTLFSIVQQKMLAKNRD